MGRDNAGGKEEGLSGTCMKDTRTKPRWVGSRVGGEDGWGRWQWWEGNGDYLNNNKNY